MRWLKMRGGAQHHKKWQSLGQKSMPAAAIIGANPALTLAAVMILLINLMVEQSEFLCFLKVARVTRDLKHFQPISILSRLSKIAEKLTAKQMQDYLEIHDTLSLINTV